VYGVVPITLSSMITVAPDGVLSMFTAPICGTSVATVVSRTRFSVSDGVGVGGTVVMATNPRADADAGVGRQIRRIRRMRKNTERRVRCIYNWVWHEIKDL
jgi:hypothetical protein